jgi:hypothetical protein
VKSTRRLLSIEELDELFLAYIGRGASIAFGTVDANFDKMIKNLESVHRKPPERLRRKPRATEFQFARGLIQARIGADQNFIELIIASTDN